MGQLRQTHCPVGAKPTITLRGLMLPTLLLGFAVSSIAAFATTSLIGSAARTAFSLPAVLLAFALAACALIDLTFPRIRPTLFNRQTPRTLSGRIPPPLVGLAWGLDTGTVVSTFRASAASWAALILTFAGWGPWWAGALYAAGFCIPLGLLIATFPVEAGQQRWGFRHRATESLVPLMASRVTVVRWAAAGASLAGVVVGLNGMA